MFDYAFRTLQEMDRFGTPRSAISFNSLLLACNLLKLFDKVPQLFDEIPKKYGVFPDAISYGILVKTYCQTGETGKAMKILSEMEKNGVEVSCVTFTTIMDAIYKKGEAEKGCEAAVALYNVRIGHCHGGKAEKVEALIEEMSNAGLKPDTISYNSLMTCHRKSGMMEQARKVYDGLEEKGCTPNAATFRNLVYYLCRNGDFDRGYKVFKKSVMMNKIPDFNTTKILVEGLVKN